MPEISPLWATTTIVIQLSNGQQIGSATGFFFSNNEHLCLVTNKHVIYGDNYARGQPVIDSVTLNLHTNPENLTQNQEVTIALFDGARRKWLEHAHPAVDVVLIPLNIDRTRFAISPLDNATLELTHRMGQIIVDDFQRIFVMGYPFGWYDHVNNLPITRIGHLSSPFKVPFQNMPLMIGDVTTHPGMSGGPVFMMLEDFGVLRQDGSRVKTMGTRKLLLVGINSGQFSTPEGRVNLISIWFPEIILEVIQR
ncbi:serine protease [Candidatus Bathyarchaeota archaeon]|nr:serine protease [Candidatus Bathyarchaeota archaeon]